VFLVVGEFFWELLCITVLQSTCQGVLGGFYGIFMHLLFSGVAYAVRVLLDGC